METVRAYSTLAVKSFSEEEKGFRFAGLATSPVADRANDRIDPLGAKYRNPVCLLRAHDHLTPIGECNFGRPTKAGITFEAKIPKISEPGLLKDRLEMAAQEVRSGLMRGVSIGFRPTKAPAPNELGGLDYPATEIYELSTCAVPMHQLATIDQIKAIDAAILRGEAPAALVEPTAERFDEAAYTKMVADVLREVRHGNGTQVLYTQGQHSAIKVGFEAAFEAIAALRSAIGDLRQKTGDQLDTAYKGIWREGVTYQRGSFVTFNGSMWHADKATDFKPGEGGGWTLAVRKGRDGKDAH